MLNTFLSEFLRVLKKDGNLIIDINGPKSGHFFNKNDYYSLKSKQIFIKLLKKINLKFYHLVKFLLHI